ncbi:MAG: DUF58 domain-containing protein [Burkholderiales bacterium]|nr:DUF58 domain-containing protein [Burkholderiales bacterium]
MAQALHRAFGRVQRWSAWVERRFTAAGLGVLYLMIAGGVFGLDVTRTMAFQLFALAAALLLVAWCGAGRWRPGVVLERRLPGYGTVGEPMRYTILVRATDDKAWSEVVVRDELDGRPPTTAEWRMRRRDDAGANFFDRRVGYPRWVALIRRLRGGRIAPVRMPPMRSGHESTVEMAFTPERRGIVRFARVRLLRPDPLGLINAVATRAAPQNLLVLPQTYPVPAIELPGTRRHHPGGVQAAQAVGESQEFLQLRDYRPGDPLRRLHWPSTARAGRPVVRETGEEFFTRFALVLDTFPDADDPVVFEAAVSVTASLATRLALGDALLDLLFVEDRAITVTAGRGLADTAVLLHELAQVEPGAADFGVLAAAIDRHGARMSACLHILLAWDAPRRALVQDLRAAGVAQIVLVVSRAPIAAAADVPFHVIDPVRLADTLAAMPDRCR